MIPSARVQSAIDLLDAIIVATRGKGASADRVAAAFFAARRYAGSKDRRAIRDLAWRAIRTFGERPESGRAAMVALAARDEDLAVLFDGSSYGPALLNPDEARAVEGVLPGWLTPLFSPLLAEAEWPALLERAPLDLRVNSLAAKRADVAAQWPEAEILGQSRDGLRLPTGFAIETSAAYGDGQRWRWLHI
jgi:16S rRNA (cytosine967-C5)-methyltransferase